MSDESFVEYVADRLSGLRAVKAVALGGSRAAGTNTPESDWDFGIYYRGSFDPQDLRDLGWSGSVFEIGDWGGGVFNGGAWLIVEDQKVDVHYRDLDVVEREIAEADLGRFRIEPLLFHLAGIPTYLLVAELAVNRVLRGDLPTPTYPVALNEAAPKVWAERAELLFGYARSHHAKAGRVGQCVAQAVEAASCYAHAIMAARSTWVTNEKDLLVRAGLTVDGIVSRVTPGPDELIRFVDEIRAMCVGELSRSSEA